MVTDLVSGRGGILIQSVISKTHFFPIIHTPFFGLLHHIYALYTFYIILYLLICACVSSVQWHFTPVGIVCA